MAEIEESEPPIRRPRLQVETRSPERIKLSEELAVLNRPLAEEVEYYDVVPPSRAKPVFAVVVLLAAVAGAGYWSAQRHGAEVNAAAHAPGLAAETRSSTSAPPGAVEPEGDPPVTSAGETTPPVLDGRPLQ